MVCCDGFFLWLLMHLIYGIKCEMILSLCKTLILFQAFNQKPSRYHATDLTRSAKMHLVSKIWSTIYNIPGAL